MWEGDDDMYMYDDDDDEARVKYTISEFQKMFEKIFFDWAQSDFRQNIDGEFCIGGDDDDDDEYNIRR